MIETETIIRNVRKKAPSAKLMFDAEKNLYVDVNGTNLSEEHLLPPTKDPHRAWELAELSLKITQNFNRTHPLKSNFYSKSDTAKRINRRKQNTFGYHPQFENE